MRKLLTFVAALLITGSLFAGGLVTNTNQSAMYTRLQSRNASTGIDAVYYNPAGLTKLGDGFFVSLNNQTVGQTKTINEKYMYMTGTPKDYIGKVSAPLFPGIYLAYNTGKFSFSAGVNPIGGGGGAKYDKGLPSFEMKIADIVPSLKYQGIPTTSYSGDIFFEGSSVYMGYQANVAYKVNDMFSVAAGVRLVSAANTYTGYLKKISINPNYPAFGATYTGANMVLASAFFTDAATYLGNMSTTVTGLYNGAVGYSSAITTIIGGGGDPATLLTDGAPLGLDATAQVTIAAIITAAGYNPTGMNIGTARAIMTGAAPTFQATAAGLATKATAMTANAAGAQDIEVDAERSGMGYTPIISVNFSPSEKLNIALKYEFQTKLELATKVNDNKGGGIFIDGSKVIADMPAMLAAGFEYKTTDKLMISASMNYYFDKNVDYDGSELLDINMIDNNFTEYALGFEYSVSEKLRASAGWLATFTGVNANYQNDQTYSLNTNSFGAGVGYRLNSMIDLNIGGQYTFYNEGSKKFDHRFSGFAVPVIETYNKNTWVIAVGANFTFGKTKE
jgi:long-chain fatty acid transport protein